MGFLRLWLALAVVAVHAGNLPFYRTVNGMLAVKSFYVISGFYMSLIREKYAGKYVLFLSNRFLRLWPAYFAVAILTVIACLCLRNVPSYIPVSDGWKNAPASPTTATVLIASNATLMGQDALMFSAVNPDSGALYFTSNFRAEPNPTFRYMLVPQAWSVSLEFLFYLLAPFLTRLRVAPLILVALASIAIRAALRSVGWIDDPWNYRFFPAELYCFIFGILSHRIYEKQLRHAPSARADYAVSAALLILIAICEYLPFPYKNHLLPLLVCVALPALFRTSGKNAIDRFVGELSYPVYIVHLLVLSLVGAVLGHISGPLLTLATMTFSVLAAVVLYMAVDRPVDAWRQRRAAVKALK